VSRRTIAIVGAGVVGWTCAAALARHLPRERYRVCVVPDVAPDEGLPPVVATLPGARAFHDLVGLDEAQLIREAHGAVSLGVALSGWTADGGTGFLPFDAIGAPLGSVAFHQLVARVRAGGMPLRMGDYAFAALAAQAARFGGTATEATAYGLHLDAARYARLLAEIGRRLRVEQSAPLAGVEHAADGSVTSLRTADGSSIAAMLYLDCSGARARLRGDRRFESWREWLPADRLSYRVSASDTLPPLYSHVQATAGGWIAETPILGASLQTRCWEDGAAELADDLPEPTHFASGRVDRAWHGNAIAIGPAAFALEPLHAVTLHLVQSAVARLIALFPHEGAAEVEAAEYNRVIGNEMDSARDYVAAHRALAANGGGALPDRLAYRIDLFRSRGRIVMYDDDMFDEEDWIALFDLLGVRPRRYDVLADRPPASAIERHLAEIRAELIGRVRATPLYADTLRQWGVAA
jgi:tryptophan 7-halogenase